MLTVALCPADTVNGRLGPLKEKYLLEMATPLTVTELPPVFVAVSVIVRLVPAGTLPKLTGNCPTKERPAPAGFHRHQH